jgi:hypothetical protein
MKKKKMSISTVLYTNIYLIQMRVTARSSRTDLATAPSRRAS